MVVVVFVSRMLVLVKGLFDDRRRCTSDRVFSVYCEMNFFFYFPLNLNNIFFIMMMPCPFAEGMPHAKANLTESNSSQSSSDKRGNISIVEQNSILLFSAS